MSSIIHEPTGETAPQAVAVTPGSPAAQASCGGHVRISVFLDSVRLVAALFRRPLQQW